MEPDIDVLKKAACEGDLDTFETLARPLLVNPELLSDSLDQAIKHDKVAVVRWLLNNDAALVAESLVQMAVRTGAFEVLSMLIIEHQCDINKPMNSICPPVLRCVFYS